MLSLLIKLILYTKKVLSISDWKNFSFPLRSSFWINAVNPFILLSLFIKVTKKVFNLSLKGFSFSEPSIDEWSQQKYQTIYWNNLESVPLLHFNHHILYKHHPLVHEFLPIPYTLLALQNKYDYHYLHPSKVLFLSNHHNIRHSNDNHYNCW